MRFPTGKWGNKQLTFHPAPMRPPFRPFAALVFAWQDEKALICKIPRRGWCIPSGRVEPFESGAEAARREALEEGGALLDEIRYIGCYQIADKRNSLWAEAFTASISEFIDIPPESESEERRLVTPAELPDCYHFWDPLTQAVFEYSKGVFER